MFEIYRRASKCYVHLADVHTVESPEALDSPFRKSKWFTRGWTLQELIAPSTVEFFTSDWRRIGDKEGMVKIIEEITRIEHAVLRGTRPARDLPIARVMMYATKRETTRTEDRAYSLMGLFGVNMPTIYGEGGKRAFARLQYEIMARSPAHSLLAWIDTQQRYRSCSVLAPLISCYSESSNIVDIPYHDFAQAWKLDDEIVGFHKGPHGLRAKLPIFDVPGSDEIHAIAVIACKVIDSIHNRQHTVGLAQTLYC